MAEGAPGPVGPAKWVAGARPRTLGVSAAPVVVGTCAAFGVAETVIWWRAIAALVVALALQVGTNYANDYSDGIRGTDRERRGPVRLTASGLASPGAVRAAAGLSFLVAAVAGLVLAVVVDPWLLLVGVAAIAAGALYTGGPRPYGYAGLGELMVLVFFGFVATAGSAYVQLEEVPATAWWGSLVVGLPTVGVLLANNIRDLWSDAQAGKHTLAVRLGPIRARQLFGLCIAVSLVCVGFVCIDAPWALLAYLAIPFAIQPIHLVLSRDDAPSLVAALVGTVRYTLVLSALLGLGLAVS
ncbi:MAG: 1,4-dihydroxy-2-naphthoate octaprenyltransferase [Acidimicrobiia bacterium]